jgi:hypothetical protein
LQEVSKILVPNETDQEAINQKVAKLISTIIVVANEVWNARCGAMAIYSGCRVAANRKIRLLRRVEELQNEIVAVGLGHVQQNTGFKMAMWTSDEIEVWIKKQ